MKNSLTKSTAAFKTLALSAFALVTIGLASCQDLPTPTSVDNQNTNAGLVVGQTGGNNFAFDQNNNNGFSALGDDRVAPKKRIPIRCLNLTADQMAKLKELNQASEAAKKAAREEFNKTMREIKASSSTTMTPPDTTGRSAIEAQIKDLMAQDAAIQAKMRASQEELNKQLKAIEAKYAEQLKNASATGGTRDNPAVKEIMAKRDAEMKAARAANEASNKELKAQSESIRKQIETLKKSLGGKEGGKDTRNTLSDEVKAKIKAAEDAFKAKLAEIDAANDAAFRALLTPEQIAILENWLATGKGCDEPKKK